MITEEQFNKLVERLNVAVVISAREVAAALEIAGIEVTMQEVQKMTDNEYYNTMGRLNVSSEDAYRVRQLSVVYRWLVENPIPELQPAVKLCQSQITEICLPKFGVDFVPFLDAASCVRLLTDSEFIPVPDY